MHELKKLDEKSLLAYWIKGEYDEADMYRELVRRARELGLSESLIETFICLSKESKEHGDTLRKMFLRITGKSPLHPIFHLSRSHRSWRNLRELKTFLKCSSLQWRVNCWRRGYTSALQRKRKGKSSKSLPEPRGRGRFSLRAVKGRV